ncbi:MAG: hypothetical protein P4L27_11845 [Ignavibacteriaceae bacterium]|nr:hypothetical protein [Ignavibacteriaceae bacterium]
MKIKDWIEILQKENPEESICMHYWQVDDVLEKAEEMGEEINREDAEQILEDMERHIDSEMGVSWTNVSEGIKDFVSNRDKE